MKEKITKVTLLITIVVLAVGSVSDQCNKIKKYYNNGREIMPFVETQKDAAATGNINDMLPGNFIVTILTNI